jgi:AraC-like DNA-binding protein
MENLQDISRYLLISITAFGVLQGLVLSAVAFFYPGRDQNSGNWLALFIFSMALVLLAPGVQFFLPWPWLVLFHSIKYVAIASLYVYITSLSRTVRLRDAWRHFIIAPLFLPIAYWYLGYLIGTYGLEAFYAGINDPLDTAVKLFNLAYLLFYFLLNLYAWKRHRDKARRSLSQLDQVGLRWIGQLITGYFLIILVSYTCVALMYAQQGDSVLYCAANMAAITAFLYFVTIKGKITPEIYQLKKIEDEQQPYEEEQEDGTVAPMLDALAKQAVAAMEQEKLYQQEALSIKDLADHLGQPPYLVSQAINAALGKTFFDLVNEYRVQEVIRLLGEPSYEQYTLLAIAYEAGFNSKTTFNTVFKKATGLTPSQYKKQAVPG